MAFEFVEDRISDRGGVDRTPTIASAEPTASADGPVLHPVDFLTDVIIAPDYTAGTLSVDAGVKDVLLHGATVGSTDAPTEVGVAAHVGVDFGPLPSVEGHVDVSPDGTVTIGGEVQATLPTPAG